MPKPFRLQLKPNLHIEEFAGGQIVEAISYSINTVYDQYDDGRWYATQRPGINVFEDASAESADPQGRGIYWWEKLAIPASYIVNNDTVYAVSYSGTAMTISAGTERVEMFEVGEYLVILDAQNNEGWTIHDSTPTTIAAISFPAALTSLSKGGHVLNGKAFVGDSITGDLYESDVEDPTTWNPLSFRQAELEPDGIVYLTKHHENIVAFGSRTTEFFYDNANPAGSSLNPRQDVSYEVGSVDSNSVWVSADVIYFVGQTDSSGIGVYAIDGFQLQKISTSTLDTFLTSSIITDMVSVSGSGFQAGGRTFYILTLYSTTNIINPLTTLVLSAGKNIWGIWDLEITGIDQCPVISWTSATTTKAGQGILSNGDLITVNDDFNPQDTTGSSQVFETGVFVVGVFSATNASGSPITITIVTGSSDAGTRKIKQMGPIRPVLTPIEDSYDISISWADEQNKVFTTPRLIDGSNVNARLNRMGSFRQRNFKIGFCCREQIKIEAIEGSIRAG